MSNQRHDCCMRGDRVSPENCCGARHRRQIQPKPRKQFQLIDWSPVLSVALQIQPKSTPAPAALPPASHGPELPVFPQEVLVPVLVEEGEDYV